MVFGLLNINKPSGPTSHDIVAGVRRGIGERRVGHAGTLDPLAEGVLILLVGDATRLSEYLMGSDKAYLAEVKLGVTTDTYDAEGEVLAERPLPDDLTEAALQATLDQFRGDIEQVPPVYSAIKVKGKTAHARTRAGEDVELEARPVSIHHLRLVEFDPPHLRLDVLCSAGTYIRSLAHDIGQALGCGAMLSGLTRTASGNIHITEAVAWDALQSAFDEDTWRDYLLAPDIALEGSPQVHLSDEEYDALTNGRTVARDDVTGELGRAYAPDGRFIAVIEGHPSRGVWQPKKVFSSQL